MLKINLSQAVYNAHHTPSMGFVELCVTYVEKNEFEGCHIMPAGGHYSESRMKNFILVNYSMTRQMNCFIFLSSKLIFSI